MLAASHSWHRLQPRQSLTFAASAVRSRSTSSNSPSGSTDEVVSDALDVEAPGEDASQRNRKQYDKWTNEEQKALINLWADRHERLESKDARKIWEEKRCSAFLAFLYIHLPISDTE